MIMKLKKRTRLLMGVLAATVATASASAISFNFSQGGFSEGATVSGSFSGSDSDLDGYLTYDLFGGLAEVTDFSLSFSGNSLVGAFSMGLPDLQALSFKLGGDDIIGNDFMLAAPFAAEGIVAVNSLYSITVGDLISYTGGPIIEDAVSYDLLDESSSNPIAMEATVAERVPDTGSSAVLLGGALFGLIALRRRFTSKI